MAKNAPKEMTWQLDGSTGDSDRLIITFEETETGPDYRFDCEVTFASVKEATEFFCGILNSFRVVHGKAPFTVQEPTDA